MSELILTENRDGVLVVTFNRPEKKNAINNEMWAGLRDTFRAASEDDKVACLLWCAAGDNFSAGVDLASFGEMGEGEEHPFESAARAVAEFDKPLVAAAQGAAVAVVPQACSTRISCMPARVFDCDCLLQVLA